MVSGVDHRWGLFWRSLSEVSGGGLRGEVSGGGLRGMSHGDVSSGSLRGRPLGRF